jgi:hypothetical protein
MCSWYSNCLPAGRPKGRSSSLATVKNFLLCNSVLGSSQSPTQRASVALSGGGGVNAAGAGS